MHSDTVSPTVTVHLTAYGLFISNSTSTHLNWLHSGTEYNWQTKQCSAVTVTLDTAIQYLHKTLQHMIMYHQTKFDCERISNSKDVAETVIF